MNNILKTALSILFLGCLADMPYGYYQFVRFVGMFGFGYLAYIKYEKDDTWAIIWGASALLINPIFKISLGRNLWNIIDIVWVILLIYSIVKTTKNDFN